MAGSRECPYLPQITPPVHPRHVIEADDTNTSDTFRMRALVSASDDV